MTHSLRTRTAVILLSTVTLTAGCGGTADKIGAARSDIAGAAAAASSAEAAIAALGSKLAALTSATPVPVPSAVPTSGAVPTSAAAPTPSATPAASTGGLPVVPSGAALSSLLATPSSSTAAPAATNLAAAQSAANAALGGALSALDVTKQCAGIPTADVQALVKKPIGAAHNEPEQCGWTGTDLDITINLNDADKHDYADLAFGGHPIAGLGDVAEWSAPGGAVVDVNAHKGKVTCYVEGAQDIPNTTEPYTGKAPFYTIKPADQLAYAIKEAKLCADVFKVTT